MRKGIVLQTVSERLQQITNNNFMSKDIYADLIEAEEELEEPKRLYNQKCILYNEIKEILLENNYGLDDEQFGMEENAEHPNIFKIVCDMMSRAECKNSLNISMKGKPTPQESLFGLTKDDFELEPRNKKIIHQNIQQHCIPLMEQHLKNKCIQFYQIWSPSNKESEGLVLAKANQLALTINKEKKKMSEMKKHLKAKEEEYKELCFHFDQSLSSLVNELEEKVCSLKEKPQISNIKITSDWIDTKCNYILAKLRFMKLHILSQTYNEETLPALEKVRYHLADEMRQTEKDLKKTKQAVFMYESIGDTFTQLLKQYAQLTTELDNKKWALSELNKDKS